MAFDRPSIVVVALVFVNLVVASRTVDSNVVKDIRCDRRLPKNMSLKCPTANEVFVLCTEPKCIRTCADLATRGPSCHASPSHYAPDCICKEGWLRDKSGVCVLERQCFQRDPNENYVDNFYFQTALMQMKR